AFGDGLAVERRQDERRASVELQREPGRDRTAEPGGQVERALAELTLEGRGGHGDAGACLEIEADARVSPEACRPRARAEGRAGLDRGGRTGGRAGADDRLEPPVDPRRGSG